jgi:hypothetical protein
VGELFLPLCHYTIARLRTFNASLNRSITRLHGGTVGIATLLRCAQAYQRFRALALPFALVPWLGQMHNGIIVVAGLADKLVVVVFDDEIRSSKANRLT